MKFRSYNNEVRIALGLVSSLFNNIAISRFDKNNNVEQTLNVPLVIGSRSRILKELENPNKTLEMPIMSISKEGYTRDPERMHETHSHLMNTATGYTIHEKMRGVPINIRFKLSGIAKYDADIDQMISNFIPFFKPDVYICWKHPKYPTEVLKCPLVWDGNIDYQAPTEYDASEIEKYQFETSFIFKTWFFAGMAEDPDDGPLIKILNSSDNMYFKVGDDGYGMQHLYMVPKIMTLKDYKKNANDGLIDQTQFDTVSYPRVVRPDCDEMLSLYPAMTKFTAATLKITLLDEDKTDPDYDATVWGFTSDSCKFDAIIWHARTDVDLVVDGQNFNYIAESIFEDSDVSLTIQSELSANFDWTIPKSKGPVVSSPVNIKSLNDGIWVVQSESPNNSSLLNIFDDNATTKWSASSIPASIDVKVRRGTVNIKHYAITSSDNINRTPRVWSIEGTTESGNVVRIDRRTCGNWQTNETKYFDLPLEGREFLGYKLIIEECIDPEMSPEIVRFRAWSDFIGVEGGVEARKSDAKFSIIISKPGDDEFSISMEKSIKSYGDRAKIVNNVFGTALYDINEGDVELFDPSADRLSAVFFRPNHYLIFKYKGRKYGLSIGGYIADESAQSITYGDSFPANPADGSLHVMTNIDSNPMYQYEADSKTWFEIGTTYSTKNQKINIMLLTGVGNETTITKGNIASFSCDAYATDYRIQYLSLNIKANEAGKASFKLTSDGVVQNAGIFECDVDTLGQDYKIPFKLEGPTTQLNIQLNSLGTTVQTVTLSEWEVIESL